MGNSAHRRIANFLLLTCAALQVAAQSPSQTAGSVQDVPTIRVDARLLEIPVLVLGPKRQSIPPIDPQSFLVQIDHDARFHPRHVRVEGDDPITLTILVDVSTPHNALLPHLGEMFAQLIPTSIREHDRVTVYGFDGCSLRRYLDLSPPVAQTLQSAVSAAAETPAHDSLGADAGLCKQRHGLWDVLAWLSYDMAQQPGYRILLTITNGVDGGSKTLPYDVRGAAIQSAVTIVAIAERNKIPPGPPLPNAANPFQRQLNTLSQISESTGGIVLETEPNHLLETGGSVMDLIRGRYILDFAPPPGVTPGPHKVAVTFGQPHDFIRIAGTSIPLADRPIPAVDHDVALPPKGSPETAPAPLHKAAP
jgi:hypothetical protein